MEFHMEWNVICRVCLQEGEMSSIYETDDSDMLISDKIMLCSSIKIDKESNMPEQICTKCLSELNTAYNFRINCENSNSVLKYLIQGGTQEMVTCSINGGVYKFKPPKGLNVKRVRPKQSPEEVPESYTEEEVNTTNETDYEEVIEVYEELDENNYVETEYEIRTKKPPRKIAQTGSKPKITLKTVNRPKSKANDNEKPFICEICANTYKQKHALEIHMRRHRNEKNYVCDVCNKAFVLNVELNCHMRRHTGHKPYPCRYCGRRFGDFGSRIKHERTHTGERPYPCGTCGKAFAYSYGLSSHMLTHTGEKPYECEKCSKRFAKKHHLRNHLNTHLKQEKRIAMAQKSIVQVHTSPTAIDDRIMEYAELIKDMTTDPNTDQCIEEVDVIEQIV